MTIGLVEMEIWGYLWSRDQRIMWLDAWRPYIISHHLVKFGSYGLWRDRDIFYLCHVTIVWCDHFGWWPLPKSHEPVNFGGYRSQESGNITCFIYHVTQKRDRKEMWLCGLWLLILRRLPVKFGDPDFVKMEIKRFLFVMRPNVSTWLTGYMTLWTTFSHHKVSPCHVW